ncbi:MAG: ABC transporter permease [Clostridia bacterium]|nr:ABC transporter permease [Clostridia bacterium]
MGQIFNLAYYEMRHILRNKILFLMVFIVPLGYAFLFGTVYMAGVLTDIPLGMVDLDQTPLSREVVDAFASSPNFEIVEGVDTYAGLEKGMREGVIRAGVVIPENFQRDTVKQKGTQVLTVYDGSNLIWGLNTRKYALEAVNEFTIGHASAFMAGMGMGEKEIRNTLDMVSVNLEYWYNPTFNYTTFLFMGIILMVIHQIGLLSVSLTVAREKEQNSWIQYVGSVIPRWKIFVGKCLPYFAASFFNYALLLWFSARYVNVKMEGSMPLILLMGLLFVTIITALGFFISVHSSSSLQITRYIMLLSIPMFMISGFVWPPSHIPKVLNKFAKLLPYTWMANAFRMVTVKGLGLEYLHVHLTVLAAMAILSIALALSFNKRRSNQGDGLFG